LAATRHKKFATGERGRPAESRSGIEIVPFLAVLRKIEAGHLVLGSETETDDFVDDKEQNQRADDGESPRNADADKLIEDLAPMAVDAARGDALAVNGIDDTGGEYAGEEGAESASRAVNAEGVEGIVVAEAGLNLEDHEGADEAGGKADENRGHRLDEAGGRGNSDEAGDRAGDGAQSCGLAIVEPLEDGPADALVASGLAARALPALKPNQPTQSRHAPMKLSTREWGGMAVWG